MHDTEELFDKPAAERMTESLQTYRDLLTAQTNGWLVEYYPEKTQKYGGFNLYFRFEGEHVTVRSEIDPAASATSAWSMGSDMGPTINFDTYNTVLHYFSDPAINQGGGQGLNYEGDYEFYVENGTETEFILRGKKTRNIIRMTPFPANFSWGEYGNSLQRMRDNVIVPAYKITVGNREIAIEKSIGANFFILKINDETIYAPFMVTLSGIKFYTPIEIGNETLQLFTYHAEDDNLISDQRNSVISFPSITLSNYFVDYLTLTNWYFKTEDIGQEYLPAWDAAKDSLNKDGETLLLMWFGALDTDFPAGISFACWDEENNAAWFGTYVYDFEIINDNRIKFVYNSDKTVKDGINAEWYAHRLQDFTIAAFDGKTFTLEPDVDITNPKNFTKIQNFKLTDTTNPNHWVNVGMKTVIWP